MSQIVLLPEIQENDTKSGGWMVVIFNNDHTAQEDVIEILMRATGCDMQEAYIEMWEAHTFGKASVHFAGKSECDDTASVISSIGVKAEVTLEWPE